jgi:DNA polymerase-3 subunit epsilon
MAMNFLAVDVETANADMASICAIGFVYFKDGQEAKRLSFLINPEDEFDGINIGIHGIHPQDVINAPKMRDVFPSINAALNTAIVVHHTHFDKVALCRAAERNGFDIPACRWLDTAKVARRAWTKYAKRGYGLKDLASDFGINFEHHQAAEDAYCAGEILIRALRETGTTVDDWFTLFANPPSKSRAYREKITREGDDNGPLAGEILVFTGELSISRNEAADLAARIGCDVTNGVTKQTTILVVGDVDIRRSKDLTAKHAKAKKLIESGQRIRILGESDFRQLVNY